jgi:Ca-activated chloride channel family protein
MLLLAAIVLSACSSEKEEVTAKTPAKEKLEENQESILAESENTSLEVSQESLLNMPPGTLMDSLSYEEDIEQVGFNSPETDPELKNKMAPRLEELAKETTETDSIKKGLVALFASPHYKDVIKMPLNRSNKLWANRKYENTIINRIIALTMFE